MDHYWNTGESCVLRGITNQQVWLAQSVIVVQDTPQETILLLLPDAQCAYPAGYWRWKYQDFSQGTRWHDMKKDHIILREFGWLSNRVLMFLKPEKYYSCYLFWNQQTGEFGSYYINFQLPYRRSHCGFDTLDLELDIVIDPQFHWKWKDEDNYHEGIREGCIQSEWVKGIEQSQEEVLDIIHQRRYPLDGSWLSWCPSPTWTPPRFPERWQEL